MKKELLVSALLTLLAGVVGVNSPFFKWKFDGLSGTKTERELQSLWSIYQPVLVDRLRNRAKLMRAPRQF